ncbi:pectinesterase 2-like [Prosopis cineraria]|uniref:pectinesterase 2-like n=1 Tax=Prosopis cineraria TaxID=364024 RepID=UPI00240F386A|nr:pectinesterase 2-like [Prosopis cineraria]
MAAFRLVIVVITLVFVPLFLFCSSVSGYSFNNVKVWCNQTPNPQPCEYFLNNNNQIHNQKIIIKHKDDFLKLSLQLAQERALKGHATTLSLGPKCRNSREKAAWADCIELYEQAIQKLNKTLDPNTKCSKADAQTWLSAAVTNLDTCRAGFYELGVQDYVLPLMSNNVTKLLSNTLALNKVQYQEDEPSYYNKDGFPTWVKPGDRKLLQRSSSSTATKANVVVAKDGSGKYTTLSAAINAAPKSNSGRYAIYVKAGIYNEQVEIKAKNIMLMGDGIGKTIITGSKSVGGGTTTFRSATVAVVGDGFIARDITFRNTAGASNHQAVALRSGSDLSVFYRCSFEGYQDTLYVHSDRQFYRECNIYGTVDFIFGNAAAVFQNCNIFARNPPNKVNTITAQGRTDPNQNTGISIHNCRVTAASDLKPVQNSVKTYLGRPWKQYSRTVFMKTYLDGLINQAGWMEWSGNFALNTLYYGEYMNTGPGSSTANRVKWSGYRVITSASEASKFTVANFIGGNSWIPATNVPFTSAL